MMIIDAIPIIPNISNICYSPLPILKMMYIPPNIAIQIPSTNDSMSIPFTLRIVCLSVYRQAFL
jgi:hypothetical protein